SANIAGWSIDASAIYSGTRGANGAYTTSGMTIGSAGYISSPNTFISSTGVLYSKSGNIAGYSFDAGKFYVSTDFVLDAANKKWYFANKSTYATTTAGIFMGLDAGVYKVNIGGPTNNIKWTGTALEINGGSLTSASIISGSIGAVNITGATITGATITGGTIQTAASGKRVMIDGTNKRISFYDSSDNMAGYIEIAGAVGYEILTYYSTTGVHTFVGGIEVPIIVIGGTQYLGGRIEYTNFGTTQPTYRGSVSSSGTPTPPSSPVVGDIYWEIITYPTTTKKLKIYTPDGWKTITLT
ncbi:MAG TPA: hypothetical protein VHP30_10700, partial [Ignavibacteriales bacterium]|nr:hypothetical protein [Ignavibacteriales bacterium]